MTAPDQQAVASHCQQVPPARDGQIAIREEFDLAKQMGTLAQWDLFIARHPGNELIPAAQMERNNLITAQATPKIKSSAQHLSKATKAKPAIKKRPKAC